MAADSLKKDATTGTKRSKLKEQRPLPKGAP